MAYGIKEFLSDVAILNAGAILGKRRVAKAEAYALKKGFQLSAIAGRTALSAGARFATANPVTAGVGLGLGALATPPGERLLEMAEDRGRSDRIRFNQAVDDRIMEMQYMAELAQNPTVQSGIKTRVKRKTSKYGRAIKAGMKALKASSHEGKKGTLKSPKKALSKVSKVASALNKGKKITSKGVTGIIKRGIGRIL